MCYNKVLLKNDIQGEHMGNNYVDKEELMKELILLNKTDQLSDNLHLMFFSIAKNYATINSFRNYTYIEDMISEAYINCIIMAHKFDINVDKPNPFAYFTTVIHRNFLKYIAKEKKQQAKKWIELKKLVEMYKIENKLIIPLPKDIMNKIEELG